MGVPAGAVAQNRGPHLTSALLIQPSERVRCTDSDLGRSPGRRRISLRPPLPHRPHLRGGPGLKSFPAPSHLGSAFASTERPAHGEI